MSNTIYLVRHGKDEEGYRGGWSQRGLIEEGRSQSKQLADYLYKNKDTFIFSRIISSDLNRAKETAQYISEQFEMEIEFKEEWRETNNGALAGLTNKEAEEKFPNVYFSALDMDEQYPGGESPREFYIRIKETFEKLVDEVVKNKENALVVTHGGVINVILHIVKGLTWSNKNKKYPCDYNSIYKIELLDNKKGMSFKNCVKGI